MQTVALGLSTIQHIGIPVTNLARSEAFYQGLGFSNVMQSTFDHAVGKGNVAMMQSGSIILEIYQMPALALAEIAARKNGHIDHIAFDVTDVETVFQTLRQAGYTILEETPVFLPFWEKGCKYFNILGPDGERLEFNQRL